MLFPGVELLRFVFEDVLRLYTDMSQTDCLLFFVIVLLCALLLQQGARERRSSGEPGLRLAGDDPAGGTRRGSAREAGRKRTREPSRRRTGD